MPLDPLSLALGGLFGGGSTTQTTTVSTTASNQLAITPNSVINIGGGVSSNPNGGGVSGDPSASAQAQVVPPGMQSGFSFGFPQSGQVASLGALPRSNGGGIADIITDPFVLIGGAALIFLLAKGKK